MIVYTQGVFQDSKKPVVMYDNVLSDATVSASSEDGIFVAESLKNYSTYEYWKPASGGIVTFTIPGGPVIDYIAIGGINVLGANRTITTRINGDVFTISTLTDNNAYALAFSPRTANQISIEISGGYLGVVAAGLRTEIPRATYSGHTPSVFSRVSEFRNNVSESGQLLGRNIVRKGLACEYSFENIPIDWYESNIDPLSLHAVENPFFVAWNPLEHPESVVYMSSSADIKPTMTGVRNFCSFELTGVGHINV